MYICHLQRHEPVRRGSLSTLSFWHSSSVNCPGRHGGRRLQGLDTAGTLGAVIITQIDAKGFRNRVYRLHYNDSQHRYGRTAGDSLGRTRWAQSCRLQLHSRADGGLVPAWAPAANPY